MRDNLQVVSGGRGGEPLRRAPAVRTGRRPVGSQLLEADSGWEGGGGLAAHRSGKTAAGPGPAEGPRGQHLCPPGRPPGIEGDRALPPDAGRRGHPDGRRDKRARRRAGRLGALRRRLWQGVRPGRQPVRDRWGRGPSDRSRRRGDHGRRLSAGGRLPRHPPAPARPDHGCGWTRLRRRLRSPPRSRNRAGRKRPRALAEQAFLVSDRRNLRQRLALHPGGASRVPGVAGKPWSRGPDLAARSRRLATAVGGAGRLEGSLSGLAGLVGLLATALVLRRRRVSSASVGLSALRI
jgi:hypothetical protein